MKKFLITLAALTLSLTGVANACTGIALKTTTNNSIQARTIEWGESNLNSKLMVSPRGQEFQSTMPTGKKGLKWKAKYGFVGITVSSDSFIGEGMNEEGLSTGIFYFKNYGQLAPYSEKNLDKNLTDMEFTKWILSNFKTVDEVKEGLKNINIVPVFIQNGVPSPTGHWRVADASGKAIVIEIIKNGKINIYDNKIGVLTNAPGFDWQLTNLNNYVNLYPGAAKEYEIDNDKIFPFGAGSGMLGLPGDITPPSRFVKAFFYVSTMQDLKTDYEAVTQAFHILNNFDIPLGIEFAREHRNHIPTDVPSATQWTAVSDLGNKNFYYKTMYNGTIREVKLKDIDFSKVKFKILPLDKEKKETIERVNI